MIRWEYKKESLKEDKGIIYKSFKLDTPICILIRNEDRFPDGLSYKFYFDEIGCCKDYMERYENGKAYV